MDSVTQTLICCSSINIVYVCVGEYGKTYTREEILLKKKGSEVDLAFYICPKCGSITDLTEWGKTNKILPQM